MSKKTNGAVTPINGGTYERCKAHKKTGERCKKAPIAGGTVCRFHGGAAKQVKRTAQQRLKALQPLAVKTYERAMHSDELPTAVRAATAALDRSGMGPSSHIEVDTFKPWQKALMKMSSDAKPKRKGKKSKKQKRRTIPGELVDTRTDAPPEVETRQPPFIPQGKPSLTPLQALDAGKVATVGAAPHPTRASIQPTPKVKGRPTAARLTKARIERNW